MALTEENVRELLRVIQADTSPDRASSPAVVELVEGFTPMLRGFIRMRSRSLEDAEDILNDTWIRVLVAMRRYDFDRVPVVAMLKTIARNTAIDYYRRLGREGEVVGLIEDLRAHVERWNDDEGRRVLEEVARDERTPSPEAAADAAATQELLLRAAFHDSNSPPHELIAYGYNRYLQWPCSTLVRGDFLAGTLRTHVQNLVEEFARLSGMPCATLDAIFTRLRQSVAEPEPGDQRFGQCFEPNAPSAKTAEHWVRNVYRRTIAAAARRLR